MLLFLLSLSDESNYGKIEYIYNTYHDYMMKYAVSKLRSVNRANTFYDAEDAVQNTFMKIVKHIDNIASRSEQLCTIGIADTLDRGRGSTIIIYNERILLLRVKRRGQAILAVNSRTIRSDKVPFMGFT